MRRTVPQPTATSGKSPKPVEPGAHPRTHDPGGVAAARASVPAPHAVEAISRQLHALGEPARLRIAVALLTAGELSVRDLAVAVAISEPAASQHLRVLRAERLVRNRRQGRMVYYSLADQHVHDWVALILAHAAHDD